ncbi:GntR family transcriptional regulator [Paraburkholderia unamae]|uniref:GntR family transcriptional regulator n=1 Tax=Paraburkholderia unamae TaxID=219649 RepID=A0ABX5KQL1_9BURK|nr:GntR family transcriptional regulator [Paraburkholderia unamae]PVX83978.1 GntR family transcriptional regulator [Paraburkholderia unamae]CAG9265022.1 GntR family transcriptional regulator [Paraburkholderia unamae]
MRPSSSSPVPLYLQIADTLRDRIARGVWRDGDLIPTLEQIAGEFEVARVTARQAVQLLTVEGALKPMRGRGTYVSAPCAAYQPVHVVTSLDALAETYRNTTPELLTIDEHRRMPAVREQDGTLAGAYTYMRRVHSMGGAPYCVIGLYLEDRLFARSRARFRKETVIPILMEMRPRPMTRAHQTLTIGSADADTAYLLRIPVDAPVARVQRVFNDAAGVIVYYADVVYRGDAVNLEMDLDV